MRAKRIDANQNEIVSGLRRAGFSVFITSSLGNGFPDLVVGRASRNYLFEIKDSKKCLSQRKLTQKESEFVTLWRGQVAVVSTLDEIFDILRRDVIGS